MNDGKEKKASFALMAQKSFPCNFIMICMTQNCFPTDFFAKKEKLNGSSVDEEYNDEGSSCSSNTSNTLTHSTNSHFG